MGRSIGRRVLDFLWGPEDQDDEYYEVDDGFDEAPELPAPPLEPAPTRPAPPRRRGFLGGDRDDEVVELRPARAPRAVIRYPRSFKDAQVLADVFKEGALTIVDLSQVDEKDRAGIVRFLCGVAYGLNGTSFRINDITFVFAPRQFDAQADQAPHEAGAEAVIPRFNLPT